MSLARQLKLSHLRLIRAICQHRQLGLAADSLAMTQSGASRMLSEIEKIVGEQLFERQAKGMVPTAICEALERRAHSILLDLDDLSREVDELRNGETGVATVGSVIGATLAYVIPAVRQLKKATPRVTVQLNVETSHDLMKGLVEGRNDFVLARLPPSFDVNEFEVHEGRSEIQNVLVGKHHPLADAGEVTVEELAAYEWVVHTTREPIEEASDYSLSDSVGLLGDTIITTSELAMLAIVESTSAMTLLSSEVTSFLTGPSIGAKFRVLPLRGPIQLPPYHLVQLKGRQLSPAGRRLKALVMTQLGIAP
ncbi:MAG: LysR family transcriptional regulator [Halioglobus sp.]|nr:LysR family transcriptional regulator [Halioglobus sp.]|tara:strand:+ start:539 stop:1465 length:927 start_codon:yes stop_codon:yes gene_type:complete